MSDRRDSERDPDGREEAVTAGLVGEQLRVARAEVFRAYLQARDKARALVEEEDGGGRHRRPILPPSTVLTASHHSTSAYPVRSNDRAPRADRPDR